MPMFMSVPVLAITVEIAVMLAFMIACIPGATGVAPFATLIVTTISITVLMRVRVFRLGMVARAPVLMKPNGQGARTDGGREQDQDRQAEQAGAAGKW